MNEDFLLRDLRSSYFWRHLRSQCHRQQPEQWRYGWLAGALCGDGDYEHVLEGRSVHGDLCGQPTGVRREWSEPEHQLAVTPGKYNTVVEEWDYCGGATFTTLAITVSSQTGVWVASPTNNGQGGCRR